MSLVATLLAVLAPLAGAAPAQPASLAPRPAPLAAPSHAPRPADEAVQALASAERGAARLVVADRVVEALDLLAAGVHGAARELAARDARGADGAELADELEYALVRLEQFARLTFDFTRCATLLQGVAIDPRHGHAFARLAFLRDPAPLAPLSAFEFVGPFDNERGQGFERELPPQHEPAAASYRGKVRDVVWRRLPATAPWRGRIDLDELVRPNTQVAVLARTFVESDTARSVGLALGAREEVRVWHDGVLVFEALGAHELAPDAFVVPLELRAGWNEIALLVGSRDGTPRFMARFVEPDGGAPLALVHQDRAPDGVEPAVLSGDDATARPSRPGGARARVADVDSAEGALRRSVLELYFQSVPTSRHPGRADSARAVELAPEDLAVLYQRATTLEPRGASEEQDVNPWLHTLDTVLALAPDSAWALRQRAHHSAWLQTAPQTAEALLRRARAANPDSALALHELLDLVGEHGSDVEWERLAREVFERPEFAAFPALERAARNVLPPSDPRRLAIARRFFEVTFGDYDYEILPWLERRGGAALTPDDVRAHLARRRAFDPWDTELLRAAAADLVGLAAHDEALVVLDEALALAPESAPLHGWRARALLARGDEEGALLALERAVEYDFAAEDERRLLEHLRTLGAEPFHTRYQEPLADVLARHPLPVEGRQGETTSREVLLHRVAVDVQPDGTAKTYRRTVQRVLAESGVRELDRLPFRVAENQEVRVLTANVVRPDGTVVAARTGRSGFGLVVDLPPLAVGDVVDVEWRVDDTRPTFFGTYFGFNESLAPDLSVPTLESEIVLRVPDELPLASHVRAVDAAATSAELEDGRTELRWRAEDLAPVRPEPLMPPAREFAPLVQASSYPSWEAFGAWWWKLIEQEITVSPPMSAKVRELVAGRESRLEQLRAIYEFVVTDIRYNAWEFGVRGYQPYSAPVIFSRGFGDCKDKAILLRAMLSEVGIECWPVLVLAEDRRFEEDHTLALVEHFNHCIAYVPAQEGIPEMFLDGTARHHAFGLLPTMDDGAKVLVVKDDGVVQLVVPRSTADTNRTHSEYEIVLDTPQTAQATVVRRSFGRFDPRDRGTFQGSAEERNEAVARLLTAVLGPLEGGAQAEFSDLEDLAQPVVVTARCRPTQLARPTEGGFELPASLGRMNLMQSLAGPAQRSTDILLDVPSSQSSVVRYTLPPGAVAAEPPPAVELACEDARYAWRAERTDTGYVVTESFALLSARIPVERYEALREFARGVDEAQSAVLEVEVRQ
jgi:hypothetical protein